MFCHLQKQNKKPNRLGLISKKYPNEYKNCNSF